MLHWALAMAHFEVVNKSQLDRPIRCYQVSWPTVQGHQTNCRRTSNRSESEGMAALSGCFKTLRNQNFPTSHRAVAFHFLSLFACVMCMKDHLDFLVCHMRAV